METNFEIASFDLRDSQDPLFVDKLNRNFDSMSSTIADMLYTYDDITNAQGETIADIQEEVDGLVSATIPIGTVIDFAGSSIPAGYLECDGSAVSRTTYAKLFAVIGTTWGAGNGSTTFNLPNLGGRACIGKGSRSVGNTGGAESESYTPAGSANSHTLTTNEMPSHKHTMDSSGSTTSGTPSTNTSGGPSNNTSGTPSTNTSGGPSNNTSGTPSTNTSGAGSNHTHSLSSHNHGTGNSTYTTFAITSATDIQNDAAAALSGSGYKYPAIASSYVWGQRSATGGPSNNTSGGESSHTHGLGNHTHTLSSHTHGLGNHTHTLSDHTHGLGNHTHSVPNHTHTMQNAGGGGGHSHGFTGDAATISHMQPYAVVRKIIRAL